MSRLFNLIYKINSVNKKTGIITNTYRAVGDTCPDTCPFLKDGSCYAQFGWTKSHANKSKKKLINLKRIFEETRQKGIYKIIRLHVSGDFFKINPENKQKDVDKEYINELIKLCREYPDITVYTYTHGIDELVKAGFTKDKFPSNFIVIASVHSKKEGKRIKFKYGFKYARVEKRKSKLEKNEAYCPYDRALKEGRQPSIQCITCGLCFKSSKDIVFEFIDYKKNIVNRLKEYRKNKLNLKKESN